MVSKNFKIGYEGFVKNIELNILRKKVFQNSPSDQEKIILDKALEIIYEFGRHFWWKRDFSAIFWDFHITKSDKSKNVSEYGLNEYIDEEKSVKKNLQKKWHVDIWRNSRFLAEFELCGHFLATFT